MKFCLLRLHRRFWAQWTSFAPACLLPTARSDKSCHLIQEIPFLLKPLVFLVQPLYLASQLPDLLRQAHCIFGSSLLNVQVAVLCRLHPPVQRSVRYLKFLAGSLYPYFQRQLYWLLLVAPVVFLCLWHILHLPGFSIFFWAWGVKFYYTTSLFVLTVVMNRGIICIKI